MLGRLAGISNVSKSVPAVSYSRCTADKHVTERTALHLRAGEGRRRRTRNQRYSDFEGLLKTRKAMLGVFSNLASSFVLLFHSLHFGHLTGSYP